MGILLRRLYALGFIFCASAMIDIVHRNLVGPFDLNQAVDCAMRNLTYARSNYLLPARA